jgi:nucleoside-diphosphate-sugar epimerase
MRVLVTGATGPFGRAVSRRLIAEGHDVVAMARRAPASPLDGASFCAGDIQDQAAVRAAMTGCDAVVHLAWVVAPLKSESQTAAINLGGTQNVLDAMAATGCARLVFSSSVLAYGAVPGHPAKLKESDERRPEPEHYYAAHKKAAEDMITARAPNSVLVRAGIIAGRDVDNTIFRGFSGPVLPVPDPERKQQFVHTDDVARFTVAAIAGELTGPVNITGAGTLTMREIAGIVGRPLVKVPERALRGAIAAAWKAGVSELQPAEIGALLYMPIVDTTRLREEWGFTCVWTSRDALTDMARAAHGRVSLGKKTRRLPWRVPLGADPAVRGMAAILLRRRYADEVEWVVRNLADLRSYALSGGDREAVTAHQRLVHDLAEHAALLATIGEQHGYPRQTVARARGAVAAARDSHEEDHADPRAH